MSRTEDVYIVQFSAPWAHNFMPLSAALLRSAAQSRPTVQSRYDLEILWRREKPETWLERLKNPKVIAFSTYFWNLNQSLSCARWAKERYPQALVVFGGPSVPLKEAETRDFLSKHPFIDVVIAGEGEVVFSDLLETLAAEEPISGVSGISFRTSDGEVFFEDKRPPLRNLETLPSPFLDGTFDEIIPMDQFTGVVWETNRGCPFSCSFCYWGGPDAKISQHSLERVYAELDWIAANKISYLLGADANFGILERDLEIARYMADLNRRTGYPKYFLINWVKNATVRIFDIVDALKESDIQFLVTTSVQSYNLPTLAAVNRKNIRPVGFEKILHEANRRNFNTYSEIILGLPEESYQTFREGLKNVLSPHFNYHFNIYNCIVIPGTKMAEPAYLQKYAIQTSRCEMNHRIGDTSEIEYQDFIVGNSTLPECDWRRVHTLGFFAKALFGFRLIFFIANFLKREHDLEPIDLIEYIIRNSASAGVLRRALSVLEGVQDSILAGGQEVAKVDGLPRTVFPEYAVLVTLLKNKEQSYRELDLLVRNFVRESGQVLDENQYGDLLKYQSAKIPTWESNDVQRHLLAYNWEDYFTQQAPLKRAVQVFEIGDSIHYRDIDEFLQKRVYSTTYFKISPTTRVETLPQEMLANF